MARILLLPLAFVACTVGPDYVRPSAPVNAAWSEQHDPRVAPNAALDIAWWKTFDDPTLGKLIELAYHQNLPLQIAGLRILEARAQLGIAVGDQWPTGGPTARADMVGISHHGANQSFADHNYGEYQVGFDAQWEIDFWGKYRRGVRAANASYLATIADYDNALVALTAEVGRTYVTIRQYDLLIAMARSNEQIQQEGYEIAQARFKNGATSELDVMQAQALLEQTRASIPTLQLSRVQAANALSTLLGRTTGYTESVLSEPAACNTCPEPPHGLPKPAAQIAIGVPADVLRRRPDIRAAEFRAMAQCDRIGMSKADLYPKFTLFGFIGTGSSELGGPLANNSTIANLFGPGSLMYNLGGSVLWPILNYKRILNDVRVQDARYQQALVDYVNTVITAAQEVEDGLQGYLRESDSTVHADIAVTAAEQAVKLALVQYREGSVDYTRVLDTQRALLDSQNLQINTQSAAVLDLIALYKALGGGWEIRLGNPVVNDVIVDEMRRRTNWGGYFSHPPPGK